MDNQAAEPAGAQAPSERLSMEQAVDRLMGGQEHPEEPDKREPEPVEAHDEKPAEPEEGEAEEVSAEDDDPFAEPAEEEEADPDGEGGEEPADAVADEAKVQLPDGNTVSIAELKSGYLRQSDYTRKTQEVADHRRQLTDMNQKLETWAEHMLPRLQEAEQIAQLARPAPPDERLREEDPIAYITAKDAYNEALQEWEGRVREIREGIQSAQQAQQSARGFVSAEQMAEARAELEKRVPELKDDKRRELIRNAVVETMREAGFSEEEVNGIGDPRMGYILYLAAKAHRMEKSRPKAQSKTKGKPPVAKPSTQVDPKSRQKGRYGAAMKRLRSSGRDEDAVEALALRMGVNLDD